MAAQKFVSQDKIRSQFLKALSDMYSKELPEYRQFVEIVDQSNRQFIKNNPNAIIDDFSRVIEERHGAIRVGKASEMNAISRIFACMGMEPVNFYDLTKVKKPMPVISTAFRPKTKAEIDKSAFRMFVSMLFIEDERFFNAEQREEIKRKSAQRNLFDAELLAILDLNEKQGGLTQEQADILVQKAANALRMDRDQVIDFNLYKDFITAGNDVAADIICFRTIHINHLTPRVYDIFDAHKRMQNMGVPTIDEVQGPAKRENEQALPLLHQTSRKAPGEFVYAAIDKQFLNKDKQEQMRVIKALEASGELQYIELQEKESIHSYLNRIEEALHKSDAAKVVAIKHKARFGEIECRGVALTAKGRAVYDQMMQDGSYVKDFPKTHQELHQQGYAYYEYSLSDKFNALSDEAKTQLVQSDAAQLDKKSLEQLIEQGFVDIHPVTYEDFLPKSAAGIFESNLSGKAKELDEDRTHQASDNQKKLEAAIGKQVINSYELYSQIESASIEKLQDALAYFARNHHSQNTSKNSAKG